MSNLFIPDITNSIISFLNIEKYFKTAINFFLSSKSSLDYLFMKNIFLVELVKKTLEKISVTGKCKFPLLVLENISKNFHLEFSDNFALITCCKNGNYDMVKYLIEKKIDPSKGKNKAICFASRKKTKENIKILELLLSDPRTNIRSTNIHLVKFLTYYRNIDDKNIIEQEAKIIYQMIVLLFNTRKLEMLEYGYHLLEYSIISPEEKIYDFLRENIRFIERQNHLLCAAQNNCQSNFLKILDKIDPNKIDIDVSYQIFYYLSLHSDYCSLSKFFDKNDKFANLTESSNSPLPILDILGYDDLKIFKLCCKKFKKNIFLGNREKIMEFIISCDSLNIFKFVVEEKIISIDEFIDFFYCTSIVVLNKIYIHLLKYDMPDRKKYYLFTQQFYSREAENIVLKMILDNKEEIMKTYGILAKIVSVFITYGCIESLNILRDNGILHLSSIHLVDAFKMRRNIY